MRKDNLGDRMKGYENVSRTHLTRRQPTVIRIDGKAFHSFTRGFKKPYDEVLIESMNETAKYLCENVQGCKMAYVQSDEISLLLTDYDTIDTSAWFDKNILKMVSVSASMATLSFNNAFSNNTEKALHIMLEKEMDILTTSNKQIDIYTSKINKALFDSRVFNLPKEDVCNYFIWRQQDCTRNSIQMVGMSNFSHGQLNKKSCNDIQEMLFQEKGINLNDCNTFEKRGRCIVKIKTEVNGVMRSKWIVDNEIPVFTQNREYIEDLI